MKETFVKSKTGNREDPRFYMKLAIEVMKNSVQERAKKDPSPRVGAVLVFPNGDYDTACRGEYREGDHAEYTVMDKKHRGGDLTGCWIFATLEPCGPGARGGCKVPCSLRIADARIEKVWFGVQELNSNASGGKKYLEEMGVQVDQFPNEFHEEIRNFNKPFNDWVEEETKKREIAENSNKGGINKTFHNVNLSSLSNEALQLYITKSGQKYDLGSDEMYQDLLEKGLLEEDAKTKKFIPTGNCILLFGKTPSNKYTGAVVKVKADFGDNGDPDTSTFDKPLVLIPDLVETWLKTVIASSVDTSGFSRKKVPFYPTKVIREAIINAIIHRDYSINGAKVFVDVKPDLIEVRSPGLPASPNTIEKLRNFTATQYSRNDRLANIFNKIEFMEEAEIGMQRFRNLQQTENFPSPIIEYREPNVVVIFPRSLDAKRELNTKLKELNDEELKGYEYVKATGEVSKREYAAHFGFDDKKAYRHLAKLKKLELIGDNGESSKSNNFKYVYVNE